MHHPYRNLLEALSEQTRGGDLAAAMQLQRELEPRVVMMVRQTMTPGSAKTPMDQRIRTEARRLGLSSACERGEKRDQLIRAVAESVCRSYIADLRSPPRQSVPARATVGIGAGPSMALA